MSGRVGLEAAAEAYRQAWEAAAPARTKGGAQWGSPVFVAALALTDAADAARDALLRVARGEDA